MPEIHEEKYQLLIFQHENVGLKHCNDPMSFVKYLRDMNDS